MKYLFSTIILLTLFLPFQRIGSFNFLGFNFKISYIFLIIILIHYFFTFLKHKKTYKGIYIPLLLFFLISFLSLTNSINFKRSFLILSFTIFTASLSYLLPIYINTRDKLKKIIKTIFISTFIVCAFGIYQFIFDMLGFSINYTLLRPLYTKQILGFTRIQSTMIEPLYFANFLIIPLFLILGYLLSKKQEKITSNKNLFLLLIIILMNLLLTASRGALIAVIFSGLLFFIYKFKHLFSIKNILIIFFSIISVFIVITASLELYNNTPTITNLNKFVTHSKNIFAGASFEERTYTIQRAFDLFLEHPIIGIGLGGFGPSIDFIKPDSGYKIVNNISLEILTETGILGFFFLSLFIILVFLNSLIKIKQTKNVFLKNTLISLLFALLAVIIQYQTFSTLYIIHIWFLMGLILVLNNFISVRTLD